ncbi:hypothetical protein RFI_27526 [Reticulomyxa filosa]|uniref:Uncharacterized protein n=1 Tax=Reticulomyxa filosa TaxID=46433 RepID=X6M7E8_RETFI|nr:hypothetical protein RFI_27526 [Reticulomyxa filosa]|eukprot:ETO09854.1 hypothetical protein RFI_27526 [Reticulomyxa filosa]
MNPSLVYEVILIILQVLTAVLVISSASNVAKENSNSNGPIYSNNQDDLGTLMISSNELTNHSVSQMWKCVQCSQGFNSVTEMSVQLKNISIRIIKSTLMITIQSKKNIYTKAQAMDIFTTSRISSTYFALKYSVCASIEVDVDVIVIIRSPQSKMCKWFGHPIAQITFNVYLMIDCSSTTMARTLNLDINNIYNSSNSFNVPVQAIIINTRNFAAPTSLIHQITNQLASKIFQVCSIFQCYVLFFLLLFFLKNKKNLYRSYDVAQKRSMDDFDTWPNQPQLLMHILMEIWSLHGSAPALCGSSAVSAKDGVCNNTTDEQSNCKSVVMSTLFLCNRATFHEAWSIQQRLCYHIKLCHH